MRERHAEQQTGGHRQFGVHMLSLLLGFPGTAVSSSFGTKPTRRSDLAKSAFEECSSEPSGFGP
jgi:hypothetical protein